MIGMAAYRGWSHNPWARHDERWLGSKAEQDEQNAPSAYSCSGATVTRSLEQFQIQSISLHHFGLWRV